MVPDSYLSVWCPAGSATGQNTGPGRAARILSRRLSDTCGPKLSGNQVNESGRASEATGLLVFQYSPVIISWTSARLPTAGRGRGREGQWVAHQSQWKGFWNKRAKKTKHLLLMRHAWFLLRIHEYNLGHCLIFFFPNLSVGTVLYDPLWNFILSWPFGPWPVH